MHPTSVQQAARHLLGEAARMDPRVGTAAFVAAVLEYAEAHGARLGGPTARRPARATAVPELQTWRSAPDPRQAAASAELVACMRDLIVWAGSPSYRDLETRAGGRLPKSTLSEALRHPERLPSREMLRALVGACKAAEDWPKWDAAWTRLSSEMEEKTGKRPSVPRRGRLPDIRSMPLAAISTDGSLAIQLEDQTVEVQNLVRIVRDLNPGSRTLAVAAFESAL
ncbi:hypothetical protein [Catenulispora subtropica]|uniref:Uncharacterized protein n=1 Tax=Catenulispora subtropica TaxID=450798 RepID=A0ABN2R456_9ACTN